MSEYLPFPLSFLPRSNPRCRSFQVLEWQNLDAAAVLFLHTLLVDLIIQPADAAAVTKTFARLAGKEVWVTMILFPPFICRL
jgi:hypothetical protein